MDISSVISSSVAQTVAAVGSQRVVFSVVPPTTASSVEISGPGQLLSASTLFETGISNATNQAGFPAVLAATQIFVDAFNNFLQTDSLQNASAGPLGNLFMQVLNTQTTAGSGKSIIASLSGIGINYQAPVSQNDTGRMDIDFKTLQSAFNANPTGTTSLLAQATQSIGQFAAEFTTLFAPLNNFVQNSQLNATTAAATSETAAATAARTMATIATAATALTAAEIAATTAQPATTALLSTTQATSGSTATPTASSLPIVATPATLSTATTMPATALPTTTPTGAETIAPIAALTNFVSPIINATDPAIAAAIASYHMIDGIFDTGKPHDEGLVPDTYSYSKIGPVAPVQPVRLDLHA